MSPLARPAEPAWERRGDALEIELFLDNVLDERAVLAHTVDVIGEWLVIVQPRTAGVRASWRF